ncbi:hypothetical protein SK128_008785 [Halocaridina rubra]|uniref:Uncharacterized protein n=1 Tax=Halocaridina rubra TaxID=373956 RepID=A0AAN9A4M2_HALRR
MLTYSTRGKRMATNEQKTKEAAVPHHTLCMLMTNKNGFGARIKFIRKSLPDPNTPFLSSQLFRHSEYTGVKFFLPNHQGLLLKYDLYIPRKRGKSSTRTIQLAIHTDIVLAHKRKIFRRKNNWLDEDYNSRGSSSTIVERLTPGEGIKIRVGEVNNSGDSKLRQVESWADKNNERNRPSSDSEVPKGMILPGTVRAGGLYSKVNSSLLVKSRILIPAIFLIFNIGYWGATLK